VTPGGEGSGRRRRQQLGQQRPRPVTRRAWPRTRLIKARLTGLRMSGPENCEVGRTPRVCPTSISFV